LGRHCGIKRFAIPRAQNIVLVGMCIWKEEEEEEIKERGLFVSV
jgi:hypothetical protein